jgi:glucose-1-phosphate thymidylyltransferase
MIDASFPEPNNTSVKGLKIACIEEIAWHMGDIDAEQVKRLAEPYLKNEYGQYLMQIIEEDR